MKRYYIAYLFLQINISVSDSDEESEILKSIMRSTGKDVIRDRLAKYINILKEEFSKGMILPKKDEVKPDCVKTLTSGFNKKVSMAPVQSEQKQVGLKIDTTTINSTQKFQCRAQEFYDAMTRIEMVTAFTRAQVKMDACKGGKFALFSGNIVGSFMELEPGKRIVQQWRYKQWPEGHYSIANFDIEEKSDHTVVKLVQTGVPTSEADITKNNWDRYYWDGMKSAFGFGVFFT